MKSIKLIIPSVLMMLQLMIQNAGAGTMNISGQTLLATDAGNVGIGNRNPNVTLHVSGRVNITGYLEVGKGLNVSNGMNVLSGNVGIGTNSPQNKLEVIGATTLAGGVNASSLNVTGFSITDDSLVTLADGSRKKIKDIEAGEEVLTLDERTGKLVARKVNALLDHGVEDLNDCILFRWQALFFFLAFISSQQLHLHKFTLVL